MDGLIENKIVELYNSTPDYVSVAFGKKKINGNFTNENCFVFMVEKKKPLNEIPENEILPTTVQVGDVIYNTDVWDSGPVTILECNQSVIDNCYEWQTKKPLNQNKIRPLKGGISISSNNNSRSVGTLGFIAVDKKTNSLVGVTNAHVQVGNIFFADEREMGNMDNDESNLSFQPGESSIGDINDIIGETIRYSPISFKKPNQVDGALISIKSEDISFSESFKQFGLSNDMPMEFATTIEINTLLGTNPKVYSSGRTTGPKENRPCDLMISAIGGYTYISGYSNSNSKYVEFDNIIFFNRLDSQCPSPISAGDSGSALIADINGVWKIIGLIFAGNYDSGCACRIDFVSKQLDISAWDGLPKQFIDVNSKEKVTISGVSDMKTIECGGEIFWQIGLTDESLPCLRNII